MSDWYSRAREEDGRTDEQVIADLWTCHGCNHSCGPKHHVEREGGYWCVRDMRETSEAGYDPRSVGPCY